jgi:exodeoxyribonuclease VII large subunit
MENQPLSLYQLLDQVKSVVKNHMAYGYWLVAEISELKVNYSGHCYLELIEKEKAGTVKARARATIWASVFRMLQPYFETTTRTALSAGMKVMVKVLVEFHEVYGFSLNITDIEPSFTIGEMARQKQEIINRLIAEGVFEMNKDLALPLLPRKIAVISSRTAAGFGDFENQLNNNPYGYRFYMKLFPAVMQGAEAESSIITALDKINEKDDFFDLVVIIRGGGSQSELSCFDSYWLAFNICQFPLPVLTGIGHEQDETIADLVAHTRLKTPTAVAEFLIGLFHTADNTINQLSLALAEAVTGKLEEEKTRLSRILLMLKPVIREHLTDNAGSLRMQGVRLKGCVERRILKETGVLNRWSDKLGEDSRKFLNRQKHVVEILSQRTQYLDPFVILKRGYSVTYFNGKALKDPASVAGNEIIETRLAQGMLKSKTI